MRIGRLNRKDKQDWIEKSVLNKNVLESVIHLDDGYSMGAYEGEELVGIISFYIKDIWSYSKNKESYIDVIEVHKKSRCRGIASLLLKEVEKISNEEGSYQIRAWSTSDKVEALSMWERNQYTITPHSFEKDGKMIEGIYVCKKM